MERKITKKSQYWQMVRGICILAVIMIHCPSDQNYTDLDYTVWIVLRQFINFPVAMFIFLAGYFITPEKTQGNYNTFLFKRGGIRLLLPYLVWNGAVTLRNSVSSMVLLLSFRHGLSFRKYWKMERKNQYLLGVYSCICINSRGIYFENGRVC